MPSSAFLTFCDPQPYGAAIRAADIELFPTEKGVFHAELLQISLHRLWMQRGSENLGRIFFGAASPERAPIGFLTHPKQPTMQHCGMDVSFGDIIVNDCKPMHRRTEGFSEWASMSLSPGDLASASKSLIGRELTIPSVTHLVRPDSASMARLLTLHARVGEIAKTAPELLSHFETASAIESELIYLMIRCLNDGAPRAMSAGDRRHSKIMARFEEYLSGRLQPVYLAELCAATGASERTLRVCCEERLGMGPVRYLWLRRMHLARRALILAEHQSATVTGIATDNGFWELGRFSIEYRALFGEQPSVTLHRAPGDRRTH